MAQKFGNARWIKEGFLDNRIPGSVVGQITFAVLGPVDLYLMGDFKGEITGKLIQFANPAFVDDDVAAQALSDFEVPQVGEVSLISFDPHPMLAPHPYIEWFSLRRNHYRIELGPEAARILGEDEAAAFDQESHRIRTALSGQARSTRDRGESDWV